MNQVVLYVVVGAVAAALTWWRYVAHRNEVARARQVAAGAGLTIDIGPKSPPDNPFDLMERGRARSVRFHMWDPDDGSTVFRYEYTTGSGKNRRQWRYTCALVAVPFNAPHLTIGPEGFWSNLGQVFGIRDVEIETTDFNDRYRVACDDERFAVTLLDHGMVAWLLSGSSGRGEIRFELMGNQILCIGDQLPIEQMPAMLTWATQIRPHLPGVLADLYPVGV